MAHKTHDNPRAGSNGSMGRIKNLVEKLTPGQKIMQGQSPFPNTEINSPRYYDMQKAAAKVEDLKDHQFFRINKGSSRLKDFQKKLND